MIHCIVFKIHSYIGALMPLTICISTANWSTIWTLSKNVKLNAPFGLKKHTIYCNPSSHYHWYCNYHYHTYWQSKEIISISADIFTTCWRCKRSSVKKKNIKINHWRYTCEMRVNFQPEFIVLRADYLSAEMVLKTRVSRP